jgi:hypothetical protein
MIPTAIITMASASSTAHDTTSTGLLYSILVDPDAVSHCVLLTAAVSCSQEGEIIG